MTDAIRLLLLPIATGVLLAVAFPPGGFQILAWIALVPLGLALSDQRKWPELYIGLYLGGLAFQLIHLDWLRSGTSASFFSGPRATQWLAQGVFLALVWPAAFYVGRVFIREARLPFPIAFPIVWVAFEFVRRYWWALIDSTGYPYGLLGLTQSSNPRLMQIADIGGVYIVGALVAAVNAAIVDFVVRFLHRNPGERIKPLLAAATGVFLTFSTVLLYGTWRMSQVCPPAGPVVALMPADSASGLTEESTPESALMESVAQSPYRDPDGKIGSPDLLIWTEHALPHDVTLSEQPATALSKLARMAKLAAATLVIGGERRTDTPKSCFNSAAVIDPHRGYLGCYDKICLVPFEEFAPPGRPQLGFRPRDPYQHGTEYPTFTIEAGTPRREFSFGVAICYDTGFPELFRRFMRPPSGRAGPDFFVVPACEDHDRQMRLQAVLLHLARFRAVECRRAFVRNAEGGFSGIIDGNGTLIAPTSEVDFKTLEVLGRMPIDRRFSLYSVFGDWVPIASCLVIAFVTLRSMVYPRRGGPRCGVIGQNADSLGN